MLNEIWFQCKPQYSLLNVSESNNANSKQQI